MSKLEKYTSYKDSGVEWLGEIPSTWKSISIKRLITLLTDYTANGSFADLAKNVQYLDEPNYAQLVRLTDIRKGFKEKGVYINEKSYKYLKKSSLFGGELLMANVGAYSGHSFLLPEKLEFNASLAPNMFLIKFDMKQVNNQFIYYVLNCDTVLSRLVLIATSTAQPKLNKDNVKSIYIPLPPKEEQTKISSFLDEKTAQIDNAISQKEKLIELLKEQKQITINEAVTKGLNKDVEFKNSGVEWIGTIPKHWNIEKGKRLFKQMKRPVREQDAIVTCFRDGVVTLRSNRRTEGFTNALKEHGYQGIRKGDFIIHNMDAFAGAIGISDSDGKSTPVYAVCRPWNDSLVSSEYYAKYLRNLALQDFILSLAKGIRERSTDFRFKDFGELVYPVPPKDEQVQIVEYIANQTTKIDKAIDLQQNYIAKLKEYKASLIDSVVTGKVRVV